jgi:hypothetical protein
VRLEFEEAGPWDIIADSHNAPDALRSEDGPRFSHLDPYNAEINHLRIAGPPTTPVTGPFLKLKWSNIKSLYAVPYARFEVSGNMSRSFICFLVNNPHKDLLLYFHQLLDGNACVAAAAARALPAGAGREVGVGNEANDRVPNVSNPGGGRRQSTMPTAAIAAISSISSSIGSLLPPTPSLEQQIAEAQRVAAEARRLEAETRRLDSESLTQRTSALQNLGQAIPFKDLTPRKKQKYSDIYDDLLTKISSNDRPPSAS